MGVNYAITWAYIVGRMKEKYGFDVDSEEKLPFGEFESYISDIWDEYFEIMNNSRADDVGE